MKPIECAGYKVSLTPWHCLENQLSLYCLPGFPCETCEAAGTIQIPPFKAGEDARPTKPTRRPSWWKNASKAVQRDWLRDREGRQ